MTSSPIPRRWHEVPNAPAAGSLIGMLDTLVDGEARVHTLHPTAPDQLFRVLLLRSGSEVRAYVNRCAHFGIPLAERQDLLIFEPHTSVTCNVHYASYRWEDGVCTSGSCVGESLLSIPVAVDDVGHIRIATDTTEPAQ